MINLFKKPPKQVTRLHPELKKLIQLAFTLKDGDKKIKFYQFKDHDNMPASRYESLNIFLEDRDRGMSREEGLHWCEQTLEEINKNTLEGLSNAIVIQKYLKYCYELSLDVNLVMRLVTCAYFFEDEDLLTYDWDLADYKMELFKDHGLNAFFLSKPFLKYLPITQLSPKDMETLKKQSEIKLSLLKELDVMGIPISAKPETKET